MGAPFFLFALFCASGLGGMFRFLLAENATRYFEGNFPAGTLIVNVIGSFSIGLLANLPPNSIGSWFSADLQFLLTAGFLGGFTTVSAFSLENLNLLQNQRWFLATVNIVGTCSLCFFSVWFAQFLIQFSNDFG